MSKEPFRPGSVEDLAGYIEKHYRSDFALLFPKHEAQPPGPKKPAAWFDKLEGDLKRTALALDQLYREGLFPSMGVETDDNYGFDFPGNGLLSSDDPERYFGIGHDGGGNIFCIDAETGTVPQYDHELDEMDHDGCAFPSLDVFAYVNVWFARAQEGDVTREELTERFADLGSGANRMIDLVPFDD